LLPEIASCLNATKKKMLKQVRDEAMNYLAISEKI
jgi:hypothetical protein